jgi:hypothetical protein
MSTSARPKISAKAFRSAQRIDDRVGGRAAARDQRVRLGRMRIVAPCKACLPRILSKVSMRGAMVGGCTRQLRRTAASPGRRQDRVGGSRAKAKRQTAARESHRQRASR